MQKFKLKQFPKQSPEHVLVKMFNAWGLKRWTEVAEYAQLTWSQTMPNPVDWMIRFMGCATPSNAEVLSVEQVTEMFVRVRLRADFVLVFEIEKNKKIIKVRKERKGVEFTVNMICETEARTPSPDGKWGFNPPSILNFLHIEEEKKTIICSE